MASPAETIANLERRVAELEQTAEMFKQFMSYATYQAMFQTTYQDNINQGFYQALQMDKHKSKKRRRSEISAEDCASSR